MKLATLALALALAPTACTDDPTPPPVHVGLVIRLEAKPERAGDVAALLRDGKKLVLDEPGTTYWFGIQLGPTTFAIVDAFETDAERQAHLAGKLAAALLAAAPDVLATAPMIEPVDVIARKDAHASAKVSAGLLVTMTAKPDHVADVQGLLEQGPQFVDGEPGTEVWFGVRIDATTFAIFDAFPDAAARDAHIHGAYAQTLLANAPVVLAQDPSIEPADVVAAKL
jgi:quinol monooxygenase YgiN